MNILILILFFLHFVAKSKKQSSCTNVGKEYKPKCNTTDPCEPKKEENPCSKRDEKKSSNPCEKYQKKTDKSDVKGKSTIVEDKKQSGPCAKKGEPKNALDPCNKKPDPCAKHKSNTSTSTKPKPEPCNKREETKKSPCSKEEGKTETSKSHLPKKELRTEEKDKKATSSTNKVEIKKNPSPCSYKKGPCAEKPRSNSCGREKKKSSPCKRVIKKSSPCSKQNKKKTTDPCSKRKQTPQEKTANDCAKKSDESKTQNPCERMKTDVPCSKTSQSSSKKPRNTKPNCKPQGNETKKCFSTEAKSYSDLLNQQKRQCSTVSSQKASSMNKNFVNFGFMRHFNSKGKTTKNNSDLDHGRRSKCKSLEVKKPPNRQNDQVHQSKHSRRICYPVYDMECPKKLCKNPQKQQTAWRKPKFLKDSGDNKRGNGHF